MSSISSHPSSLELEDFSTTLDDCEWSVAIAGPTKSVTSPKTQKKASKKDSKKKKKPQSFDIKFDVNTSLSTPKKTPIEHSEEGSASFETSGSKSQEFVVNSKTPKKGKDSFLFDTPRTPDKQFSGFSLDLSSIPKYAGDYGFYTPSSSTRSGCSSAYGIDQKDEKDLLFTSRSIKSESICSDDSGSDDFSNSKYKSELCRSYMETGHCRYGDRCQFAHGMDELRRLSRHRKYKSELCKNFHQDGTCQYGSRCCFIHQVEAENVGRAVSQDIYCTKFLKHFSRLPVFTYVTSKSQMEMNS